MLDQTEDPKLVFEKYGEALNGWFDQRLEQALEAREAGRTPSLSIMVTKGTLDWAYPPFIIGSTASALGWDVTLFFTFYGLKLLGRIWI